MTPSPPHDRRGFEIALICALKVEADAVHAVFDKFWDDEGKNYGQALGDNNAYTTGVVGEHNVVMAYMPGMGKANAASVAASLRSSFPAIKLAMVVGICGGVPTSTSSGQIRLGDLIISTAVVQYDFGRRYPALFERKDTLDDKLGRPNAQIRSFLKKLETDRYYEELQTRLNAWLRLIQAKKPHMRYPGVEQDQLYEPSYLHKHRSTSAGSECSICSSDRDRICQAALGTNCLDLRCEETRLVRRSRPENIRELFEGRKPVIHFGDMGSADTVMKSGLDRDSIAKASQIIAFEMEGAGVWDHFPSIIIKGVCDYADSHKQKLWQGYAAAVAAAGMKALLKEWALGDNQSGPVRHQSATFGDGPNYGTQTGFNNGTITNNLEGRHNANNVNHSSDQWKLEFDERARKLNLNWRTSIVDLLKLLRLDSSLQARIILAQKLNVRAGEHGSLAQNMALHAAIMRELANNEGNIPQILVTG